MTKKRTAAQLERIQQDIVIAQLRTAGFSLAQIGEQVGLNQDVVCKRIKKILEEKRSEMMDIIGNYVVLNNERLERLLNSVWRLAIAGNLGAIDRVLAILKSQSNLLGLDAPTKTFQTLAINKVQMTNEQMEERIAELTRKIAEEAEDF